MHAFPRLLIVAVLLLPCLNQNVASQQDQYWEPTEHYRIEIDPHNAEVRALISRWNEIGEEIKSSKNPLAGTYEKTGYRGWLLRWSPAKGFVYVYHSEGLSIIDFSFGKVRVTSDKILFDPEREMKETFRETKLTTPREWIPADSTAGSYLVAAQEIKAFGNYVGGFGNKNDFIGPCCDFDPFFFSPKQMTRDPRATSLVVPAAYESFIRKPINGKIIYVGKKRFVRNYRLDGDLYYQLFTNASLTRVGLNVGSQRGVRKNQLFRLIGQPDPQYLKVTAVGKRTSSGVVIRDRNDDGSETYFKSANGTPDSREKPFPPLQAGIKVTTSPILDF